MATKLEISWLQALAGLLAPIVVVAAAWGANSRDWAEANAKLKALEPAINRIVRLQTVLEQHIQRGAHPRANERMSKLEVDAAKQAVRYQEILRRLDELNGKIGARGARQ